MASRGFPPRRTSALVGAILHRAMLEHGELSKRWLASLVDLVLLGVIPRE